MACDVIKTGEALIPEIMIPLVGMDKELEILRTLAQQTVEKGKDVSDIDEAINQYKKK